MSEPTTTTDRLPASSGRSLAAVAAVAMVAWVLLEFAFRRGLVGALAEPLGTGRGADALVLTFLFPVIAGVVVWLGARAGVGRSDWEYDVSLRTVGAGFGGVVAYYVVILAVIVALTTLLDVQAPSVGPTALGTAGAPAWALALLLVGNGVVVPITEELAWRGVIQTALTERYGTALAVGVTAVAFVAKHLIVDLAASPFRVASLVVLALVFGVLRARYGTASSTVAHLAVNLLSTAQLVFLL